MTMWYNDENNQLYRDYFQEIRDITYRLGFQEIYYVIEVLKVVKSNGGRVFVIGLGGSAANASHMVNDLRKLCRIEAYAPTDNIAELTAHANDEYFDIIFERWLQGSKLNQKDCLFIMSVSGGDSTISSKAIPRAIDYAYLQDALVLGICGDPKGYLAKYGQRVIHIPVVNPKHKYQHAESFQSIIWHFITTHPDLRESK